MFNRQKLPHELTIEEFDAIVVLCAMIDTEGWDNPKAIAAVNNARRIVEKNSEDDTVEGVFEIPQAT